MNRVVNWQAVIEVFERRLSLWKASQLSIGDRLVLVKAVLDSIPIYYLSLFTAPQKVLDKLDSMRMNFLWGGSENKFKIHWIKNEDVKKEKKHGGLGLARLEDVNKSLICKWIWRYKMESRALWRKVIYAIHDSNKLVAFVPCYKVVTGVWKNVAKVYGELVASEVNLRLLIQYKDGRWYWANNKYGDFSVCSLRKLLASGPDPASNYLYKWSKVVPSKINIFGWRLVRDRLATATNLAKRNIPLPSVLCRLCGQIEEDASHLFIGCECAAMIWGIVSQWCKLHPIFAFDLKDLLEIPCCITDKKKAKMVYAVILATCWAIWKERNVRLSTIKDPPFIT